MLVRRTRCSTFPERFSVARLSGLVILSSILLFWTSPAFAVTVAIVQPVRPPPDLQQALVLIHGELLAVGLEVEIVDRPTKHSLGANDGTAWVEELAQKRGIDAVVDVVGDASPVAVDVWVGAQTPGKFELSRVVVEPNSENACERLAIRTIEVLRSRFLEIDLTAKGRHSTPTAKPASETPLSHEIRRSTNGGESFGVEAGAAALASLDGVGLAVLPLARLDWPVRPSLVLQAALAGLGTRGTVATTTGSALIAQQYGLLGGYYRLRSDRWLRPFIALSAGLLHTSIEGHADLPRQGHSAERWSFLVEGGLGAEVRLGANYSMSLAAHVQAAVPYVAIEFADEVVASSGRPNLLLSITLGAWL